MINELRNEKIEEFDPYFRLKVKWNGKDRGSSKTIRINLTTSKMDTCGTNHNKITRSHSCANAETPEDCESSCGVASGFYRFSFPFLSRQRQRNPFGKSVIFVFIFESFWTKHGSIGISSSITSIRFSAEATFPANACGDGTNGRIKFPWCPIIILPAPRICRIAPTIRATSSNNWILGFARRIARSNVSFQFLYLINIVNS